MSSVASLTKIGSIAVLFAVIAHFRMLTPASAQSCNGKGAPFLCGTSPINCCTYKQQCVGGVNNAGSTCAQCEGTDSVWGCGETCCSAEQYCSNYATSTCAECAGVSCGGACCTTDTGKACKSNGNGKCGAQG